MKSLKEIALPITEEEYRSDGCMHYSTLASYERGGFHSIPTLFEKKDTESLRFGSMVDTLMTDGEEAYNNAYLVADFPEVPDSLVGVIKGLFNIYKDTCPNITDIPTATVIASLDAINYGKTWREQTRLDKVYKAGLEYYKLMHLAENKVIVSTELNNQVYACADALKSSIATKNLFAEDNPFDNIERVYQPIFRGEFDSIQYSSMMDLIYVDHDKKIILPCDLKTSSHFEDEFYKSFIDWNYQIQAREYYRVLEQNCKNDDYFKDFTILNWHFIVVNKKSLIPLVWEFKDTKKYGTLTYGKNNQYTLRDPFEIAKELKFYLDHEGQLVDKNVKVDSPNDIIEFLNNK